MDAWHRVWAALRLASDGAAAPQAGPADDDFDFLAPEPEASPTQAAAPWERLSDPDSERGREVAEAALHLDAAAAQLAPHWPDLQRAPALAGLDADGAWLLCRLLGHAQAIECPGHNAVTALLNRAIASPSADLACAGLDAALRLRAREVQLAVAERLARGPQALGHGAVDRFLQFLEQHGDGRVVRTLEALLLEHGAALSDAHAWRARHIVQSIRRGGRK